MPFPNDLKYTKSHEWARLQGDEAVIGITDFAVAAIKDIVFLELPSAGKQLEAGKPFGVIESVKAVFDLNSPLSGEVTAVNSGMQDEFGTLGADPYGKGWLIKVKVKNPAEAGALLDAAAYEKHCAEEHH